MKLNERNNKIQRLLDHMVAKDPVKHIFYKSASIDTETHDRIKGELSKFIFAEKHYSRSLKTWIITDLSQDDLEIINIYARNNNVIREENTMIVESF